MMSRGGKNQRRERVRRKKMQVCEKVEKSWNTVFFQWFVAPEGRKVGSLKRRVRSHLAGWEMNNCTRLWREAHTSKSKCTKHTVLGTLLEVEMLNKCTPLWREGRLEVNMYKAHHARSTFGRCDVEKVYAVVARSTFRSRNVENIPVSEHFWKLRRWKSACRCGAGHISKSKCRKHHMFGQFLDVEAVFLCGRCKGFCTLPKVSKTWGSCSSFKNVGRPGTFEGDLKRWISHGRRSTRDTWVRHVRRSMRWFPEMGCTLEHEIVRFAKLILRDRCSTSYDLASLFRGRRSPLDRWNGKSPNTLVQGRQLCIPLSIFEGRLAELLRFWCCQLRKLRKSRRILFRFWRCQVQTLRRSRWIAFLMLSSSKIEEVSENSFGAMLADGQMDR